MLTTAEAGAVVAMLQSNEASAEAKLAAIQDLRASLSKHGTSEVTLHYALEAAAIAMRTEVASLVAAGSSLQEMALRTQQGPRPASRPTTTRPTAAASSSTAARPKKPVKAPTAVSRSQPTVFESMAEPVVPPTPPMTPAHELDSSIEPANIANQRELDRTFQEMRPHFEDKESEQNWMHREKSILKLRKLTRGNALNDFRTAFLAGIKGLLDGIMKAAVSLRTTLSTNGCLLVQELTITARHGMDPMVEILLQTLIKLSASTKKIAAQNGNITVDVICANVSYSLRILQHIWTACQEKNVQPRNFAAGWLKTFISTHGRDRAQLEHTGGVDYIERSIKKGLADPNPGVRENMRKTYWLFELLFQDRAEGIMASLDTNIKKQLDSDPSNPRTGNTSTQRTDHDTAAQSIPSSTTATSSSRPSLKETIAARKKEAAAAKGKAKAMPPKSESAEPPMSALSIEHSSGPSTTTQRLASAPMKAPKRPELKRPATAEPIRRLLVVKTISPKLERPTSALHAGKKASHENTLSIPSHFEAPVSGSSPEIGLLSSSLQGPTTDITSDVEHATLPAQLPFRRTRSATDGLDKEIILGLETANTHYEGLALETKPEVEYSDPEQGPHAQSSAYLAHSQTHLPTSSSPQGLVAKTEPEVEQSDPEQGPHAQSSTYLTHSQTQSPTSSSQGLLLKTVPEVKQLDPELQGPQAQSSVNLADSRSQLPTFSPQESVRAISPKVERHISPLQVYEDDIESSNQNTSSEGSARRPTVLEELPNEQVPPPVRSTTSTPQVKKTLGSPEKRSLPKRSEEAEIARDMMNKAMDRVRAMSLSGQGFRTLQQLFTDNPETMARTVRFGEFFCALLDYLEASQERLSHLAEPHRIQDLKIQVLVTVRLALNQPAERFSPHLPQALCAIVRARDIPDARFNFVQNLEETAQEMYRWGWGDKCVEAVLMLVEEGYNEMGKWGRYMGFIVLGGCLKERQGHEPLTPDAIRRVSQVAVRHLTDEDADLRRGVMACCVGLHRVMGPNSGFWTQLEPAGEQACRVVAYYVAKARA